MNVDKSKLIKGKPASYPSTTNAELDSKNIFYSFIDTRFIKGEIRVLDKYPNSDGILEITDADGSPIGKIDIQLKTLRPANYLSPAHSCERSFFAYCENSILPVILVVVNRTDKVVYWRHIDRNTLLEVAAKMSGESYTISIPIENCINGSNESYIEIWTKKVKDVCEKVFNYDFLQLEKKVLENQLQELDSKMQDPTHLPLPILKDVHEFLDHYNYILDREFGAVKHILYPNFWKIGIGIIKYQPGHIQFLLYPVEFKKSQILVKEIKDDDYKDFTREMFEGNILLMVNLITDAQIRKTPSAFAYELLEDSILKVVGRYNFPIADEFIAQEYLISFIDRNQGYLDVEKHANSYQLKDLKFKLFSVLPMLAATSKSYADWVEGYNDDIDSYSHWEQSIHHKKVLEETIEKIKVGFVPKVKVSIISTLYNINLITYYINLLESKGISEAKRKYKLRQFKENMVNVDVWKTWNKDILWLNLKLFLDNFNKLYEKYVNTHFHYIKDFLLLVPSDEITIVYVLQFDEMKTVRPCIEVYYLRCSLGGKGEVLYFLEEDPKNPIDRIGIDKNFECIINGISYEIVSIHAQTLDFMFTISPTYTLMNENLTEKIKRFFTERRRN